MHVPKISAATVLVLSLALTPLAAAPKPGKGSPPVKASAPVKASTKSPKTTTTKTTTKPTTTIATTKAPKAPKTTTTTASSATKTKGPKTTRIAETKIAKADTKSAKKPGTTAIPASTTTTSTTTGSTTTAAIDFTTGKVGDRLSKNTKLRTKLETQLAALGYTGTVYEAGYGFKNFGQFNAAVQNAQNQGISFEALKAQMTGLSVTTDPTTGLPVVMQANLNPDGTVTMVPVDEVTNPAPTQSLGQAKKTLGLAVEEAGATSTTTATTSTTPGTN